LISVERERNQDPNVKVDYFGTSLFRIVNYNITSQERIESYKEFLPKYAVQWVYRRNVLNSEILGMEGDIICLQELPSDQRKEIDLEWSKCGFSSFIPEKTRANEFPLINGIFFRRVKFHLVKHWLIDFAETVPKIFSRVTMKENNFGIVALLEFKDSLKGCSDRILIANTQFSSEQSFYETVVFLNAIEDIRKKEKQQNSEYTLPVVICVDFKLKPNSSSYEFFETGQSTSYEHQLILKDAYKTVFGKDLTFKLQNEKESVLSSFIFFTNDVYLTQVMDLNGSEIFPNEFKCSDHVSIFCEFDMKK
jgi:mRNA deadenylase 3'-5' endonuclease subunit Ccr4